ncbi:MATE family efflux transporter [Streptosporangium canum]|uniref:MATE family efflux transporter n=1 Tax=Streptosporangium canum TaxID=324952 RepID=UPI00379379F9
MANGEEKVFQESRKLAALALPLALTQLAQVALTTTDTVMMGLLGTEALAAGGLAIVLFNQLRTMGVGLVTGLGNQVAAASARGGERSELRDLVRAGMALATLAGVAGALLMVGLGHLLAWLGQDPRVIELARPMLLALAPGLVPCLWFQVIRQFTVGMRRPKALVWITVVSIAVNAGLNWVLIHPFGLAGVGLATALVYLLSFLALYAITRRDPVLAPMLALDAWRVRPDRLRGLVRLGVPIAATYGSEAGFFSVVALLMGSFGAAALAAHTAVNQLVYIVFQVSVGLSHAASISVSGEVAVDGYGSAARVGRTALVHGALVATVIAVVYLFLPEAVLRPFLDADPAALAVAADLLVVAAVLQYFDSAQNIGVGLLRGLDDTRSGFRMTLIGYWAVGLPAAWLLGHVAGAGPVGAWVGLLAGLAVTAFLLLVRFRRTLGERGGEAVRGAAR